MSDFVKPEIVRLPLSGGHFIDVKQRLSHGEREDMLAAMSVETPGGAPTLDRKVVRTMTVVTYLVGWSLTDDGRPVSVSPDVPIQSRIDILRSLSVDRFDEIHQAITAHEAGATKKQPDGVPESSAISPSRSAAAGVMSGSAA